MNKIKIVIIDDMKPEANAMLQALYSRDPRSVDEHLKKVAESGPEKFMASFYVGYGHKSIGDCGTTTIFIEQVSMLTAKAVQDWPLYNGQEASTRYLNMSAQEVLNPLGSNEGKLIQDVWMETYVKVLGVLVPFLKEQFPRAEDQNEKVYDKAIYAKAFDIARGLLPAGVTTLLSWHTNLRQAYDHLQQLRHHPLEEIRLVAEEILASLKGRYSSSFSYKEYPDQEAYIDLVQKELAYYNREKADTFEWSSTLDVGGLKKYKEFLAKRPTKTELPQQFRKFGNIRFSFPLDFGSFRDIQRHRSGVMMMPLLTIDHGFFPWYLEQLPESISDMVKKTITEQEKRIAALQCSPEIRQYYIAMGYTIACELTASLPAAVYVAELRSGQTVHPTLRQVAQKMGEAIAEAVPGIALYCDMSPDQWNIKRGTQDIVKKS
jgi:thymidylate synthase ThyX